MQLNGRHEIYVEDMGYDAKSILKAWGVIKPVFERNAREIDFLHRYLKGDQPILQRVKEIRPEICNRTVENHALEIQNFKVGFTVGEPIQYVLRGDCREHDPEDRADEGVVKLNEFMNEDDKASKDKELADWIFQCGAGYRMCLPSAEGSEIPFETFILDPRQAFVALSDDYRRRPVLCGYRSRNKRIVNIYSEDRLFVIKDGKVTVKENPLGALPIIRYRHNGELMGCFESVIDLCNAINNLAANRLDGVEQFIQSFIWFHNCDIDSDGFVQLKANGGIKTKSPAGIQAQIKILSESFDQQQTQTLADDLYQKLLTIAGVPDRKASTGGNTGQALIVGNGWVMAESLAKQFEMEFSQPEKAFLRLAVSLCAQTSGEGAKLAGDLAISDIEIKFTRNKTDNLLTKTQALMNMLEAGVHPREAFKICGLFNDPEQAYQDSIPYLENARENADKITAQADNTDPVSDELMKMMSGLIENGETGEL